MRIHDPTPVHVCPSLFNMYAGFQGYDADYLQDQFDVAPECFCSQPQIYPTGCYIPTEAQRHPQDQAEYQYKVAAYHASWAPTFDQGPAISNMRMPGDGYAVSTYIDPYNNTQAPSSGLSTSSSGVHTAKVSLHSPHPTSVTSSSLLNPSCTLEPSCNVLSSQHSSMSHSCEPHVTKISVARTHCNQIDNSGDYLWIRQRSPHPAPDTAASSLSLLSSQNAPSFVDPASSAPETQLSPHDTGTDLMGYYAKIDRRPFQTPCQLLDSMLKNEDTIAATPSNQRITLSPSQPQSLREEIQRSETQRQTRMRLLSESVGFSPTDPDTLTCHEKKRHYIECLENYVLWLREQCALADVDLGEITRINAHAHKGISTRGVRTMIVYMQKTLHDDHKDTLHEEYNFLHLRGQVLDREANQETALPS